MYSNISEYFICYYCISNIFKTDIDSEYQNHVEQRHPNKPVYPSRRYLKDHGIKRQKKVWEDLEI
jgi:hypothetical protein